MERIDLHNSIFLTAVQPLCAVSWEAIKKENMQKMGSWWGNVSMTWTADEKTNPQQNHNWIQTMYKCITKRQHKSYLS